MITKAIIDTVLNNNTALIRIPFINKSESSASATLQKNLYTATICALPNSKMNYQPGDVVFVGFENHDGSKPVILGQLSREEQTRQCAEIKVDSLKVNVDTYLSSNTTIGEVNSKEIACLKGANRNLQFQIDILEQRIAKLEEELMNK